MSIAPNFPPADITPKSFFESWLPEEVARVRTAAPDAPAPDLTAVVTLSGDSGGSWTLVMKDGQLTVQAGDDGGADAIVEASVDDFRALLDPDGGLIPRESAGSADLLLAGPIAGQAKSTKGQLAFRVDGYKGGSWNVSVALGGARSPAATISLDYATYQKMLSQELPPAQAYFTGQIKMEGDTDFALQVAMAMMTAATAS